MMTRIERETLDWIKRQALILAGDRVLVALSGGADSVCLLRVLLALRDKLDITVTAAHYNHQLRGADSDGDETFVRALCERLDIPLVTGTGDVAAEAKRGKRGIEETARTMRYRFLTDAAEQTSAIQIATGHHADDNVETVLLNLVRGAGLNGLAGIPPRRGQVIRPLLSATREGILDYLADLGQDFAEDATNQDEGMRRNALRHQVLPILRDMNPNLAQTVLRQGELLRQDRQFLSDFAAKASTDTREEIWPICLSVCALSNLAPAIATRVITMAIDDAKGMAEEGHIRQVLNLAKSSDPSGQTMLPSVRVQREYDRLLFEPSDAPEPPKTFAPIELPAEGTVLIPEIGVRIRVQSGMMENQAEVPTFLFQSADICGKITVRPRQRGDVIRLSRGNGTKTVKKLMIEKQIPARQRDAWPIFADEAGVIGIFGIGIDARVAPEPGDQLLTIVVEENPCIKI